ncbi:hypothetical protein DWB85_15680 [Seongchinamella sediminis]|uniref:DUF2007 domain-containing protein n=1 Tax=Seongchinamella sediminis TaxID=2283635 RepID=A0A3L7DVM1_9GAMM|nr:DUF2007 domain-containing protein [Seongchinamella sediminis]RLQ20835.1 hypothetical protein DWB85_15680 [Seongchinamella sediminis]
MKLLGTYSSIIEANRVAGFLRGQGILCKVSDINTYNYWAITGVTEVRVWVVLDHQWEDAQALLADDAHVPRNPLPAEDIALLESSQPRHYQQIMHACIGLLAVVVLALFILFSS